MTIAPGAAGTGRPAKGATHESTRDQIRELHGEPERGKPGDRFWLDDSVALRFDGFDRVRRITIHRQ